MPIVTIDDDAQYPPTLLESLWSTHKEFPHSVVATYCKLVPGHPAFYSIPYLFWPLVAKRHVTSQDFFLPIGAEGVLYPSDSFISSYFDELTLRKLSYSTDDLWNWMHLNIARTPITVLPLRKRARRVFGSSESGLWAMNRKNHNSRNFNTMVKHYKLSKRLNLLEYLGMLIWFWVASLPVLFMNFMEPEVDR